MEKNWFSENAVYQIYPISFCDSNGDGKGDLQGIISRLDYLKNLGIHTIWLSPIYESPMVDMGYDISDYYKINPIYGTMDDFDSLIKEANNRDIKIIMDLVVNHTSNKCQWFQDAIKNPNSPYREYYIFKKGKGKSNQLPTNNWKSTFLGSAWEELENEKGTYYLHLFSKEQPDLNWHNEKVIEEVIKIMNFWLDKGVYGFRSDVISCIYKESYEDGKKQKMTSGVPVGIEHYVASEGCHKILKRLRKEVIIPHDAVFIGETYGVTLKTGPKFLEDELDTFFTFEHETINSGKWSKEYINPNKFKKILIDYQEQINWNGVYLENHDQHRSINKYIKKGYEIKGSKMLLTLIYTLRGTPFTYQGQEIGMVDYPSLKLDECNDLVTHFIYDFIHNKFHLPSFLAYKKARHNGRDDPRAPFPFTSKPGFGFTNAEVKPWQVFHPYNDRINVEKQENDKDSILNHFKKLNEIRKNSISLSTGTIKFINKEKKNILSFIRETENEKLLVILNLNNRYEKIKDILKTMNINSFILGEENIKDDILLPYGYSIIKLTD